MSYKAQNPDVCNDVPRRRLRRVVSFVWIILLLAWGVCWLYLHHHDNPNSEIETELAPPAAMTPGSETALETLAGLEFVRCDPDNHFRPLAGIACESLWTENGQLGVFQTALHKQLTLEKPRLRIYGYSDSHENKSVADESAETSLSTSSTPDVPALITDAFATTWSETLAKVSDKPFIDLSNTTQVHLRDFDCTWHRDGVETLRLQCRRARLSWRQPEVLELRGHVCLQTPDGRKLECNRARWHFAADLFSIEDAPILTQNNTPRPVAAGVWNLQLEPVSATAADLPQTPGLAAGNASILHKGQ